MLRGLGPDARALILEHWEVTLRVAGGFFASRFLRFCLGRCDVLNLISL